jgi:hypothetical protein
LIIGLLSVSNSSDVSFIMTCLILIAGIVTGD